MANSVSIDYTRVTQSFLTKYPAYFLETQMILMDWVAKPFNN